jgi:hypothetical protein
MDLDALLAQIGDTETRFPITAKDLLDARAPERVDALFDLPLLAVSILAIARHKPFRTVDLGSSVIRLLVERFSALRDATRALDRSVTLRRRSVEALVFLETTGLVDVSQDDRRVISLTPDAKLKLDRMRRSDGDLGLMLRQLRSAQGRAVSRRGSL